MPQLTSDVGRRAAGIAVGNAGLHPPLERLLRGFAVALGLGGVLVAEVGQAERAARHDLAGAGERFGVGGEQPGHLLGRLQVAVGEAFAAERGVVDGAALADARHHILQDTPAGVVVQHVAGRDRGHAGGLREVGKLPQPDLVAGPAAQGERQVAAPGEIGAQPGEPGGQFQVGRVRQQHGQQSLAARRQVVPAEVEAAFAPAPLGQRQQPAQPGPGRAVHRIDQEGGSVPHIEPAAGHQPHAGLGGALVRPRDARHAVAVGDPQRRQAEQLGLGEQLLRMAGAAQERVVGGDLQLGVGHQKTPCRNQRRLPVARSLPSPRRYSQKRRPSSSSTCQ